jgi:hypothetical protein
MSNETTTEALKETKVRVCVRVRIRLSTQLMHAQNIQEYLFWVFKLLIFVIILFKIITTFVYY